MYSIYDSEDDDFCPDCSFKNLEIDRLKRNISDLEDEVTHFYQLAESRQHEIDQLNVDISNLEWELEEAQVAERYTRLP